MKALSILQPWALLVVRGLKPIENRRWRTDIRGRIFIHAGKGFDFQGLTWLFNNWHRAGLPPQVGDICMLTGSSFPRGGIVGAADLVDCVSTSDSPWFSGRIFIHAGKGFDFQGLTWLFNNWHRAGLPPQVGDICMLTGSSFPRGGIVGAADLVDCVSTSDSPWFSGPYGFVLQNAQELPLRPFRGALGFFEV